MDSVVIVLGIVVVMLAGLLAIRKSIITNKKRDYEQDIDFIESCVKNFIITESNFHSIFRMFHQLRYRNYDRYRTEKVWKAFKKKYGKYFEKHKLHFASTEDKLN